MLPSRWLEDCRRCGLARGARGRADEHGWNRKLILGGITMTITTRRLVPALAAVLTLAACKSESDSAATTAGDSAAATAPAASTGPALSDPQIAKIALVANSADSAGGVQAQEKATNPDVKNF